MHIHRQTQSCSERGGPGGPYTFTMLARLLDARHRGCGNPSTCSWDRVLWAKHRWSPGGPPGPLLLKRHLERRCENGLVWEAVHRGRCHGAHLSLASRARPEVKSSWKSVSFWVQRTETGVCGALVYRSVHVGVEGELVLWTEASRVSWSPEDAWVPLVGEALSSGRRGHTQEAPEGPAGA